MTVSYAQFIIEFEEFSEVAQAKVDPLLVMYDAIYDAFGSAHDRAIYVRTALALNAGQYVQTTGAAGTEQNRYQEEWDRMLPLCYRRGSVSGGGVG